MKSLKLTPEEQAIEDSMGDGQWKMAGSWPKRKKELEAAARVQLKKSARVNIRLAPMDLEGIRSRAMREGMIIDYMQTHWPKIKLSVQVRDPRRRSLIELGWRCRYDERHSQQVARLALVLFDSLQPLHGLGEEPRQLLEFAALAHDIGWHIGHSSHHKHSYYLIKNGDLEGFSPVETEIIANIARYHRRSFPKKSHPNYMALQPAERKIVDQLAALLRLADGLDRGHYANVQNLKVTLRKKSLHLRLETTADPQLELWATRHKTDLFEHVYHRPITLSARQLPTNS